MTHLSETVTLRAPASEVWDLIGGFFALADWHPAATKVDCECGGRQRRIHLPDGSHIVERLDHYHYGDRTYSYTILSSPLPVANYSSTLTANEAGPSATTLTWQSEFDPVGDEEAARTAIRGIYTSGYAALRDRFG